MHTTAFLVCCSETNTAIAAPMLSRSSPAHCSPIQWRMLVTTSDFMFPKVMERKVQGGVRRFAQ